MHISILAMIGFVEFPGYVLCVLMQVPATWKKTYPGFEKTWIYYLE